MAVGGSYIAARWPPRWRRAARPARWSRWRRWRSRAPSATTPGASSRKGLEEHGVTFVGGESVSAFEGDGRVSSVLTESGKAFECDLVVVGAGVRPDMMLAQRAGLECDNGIICDFGKLRHRRRGSTRRATLCSYDSVVHGRRSGSSIGTWRCTRECTRRRTCSADADYDVVPYFFSDLDD